MKKLFTILLLLISISAIGQGNFFASHSSVASPCTPPGAMVSKILYSTVNYLGTTYSSKATPHSARDAWYLFNYGYSSIIGGDVGYSISWSVNDSVYQNTTTCTKAVDGYYLVTGANRYQDSVYKVVSGVLTSKSNVLTSNVYFGGGNLGYVLQSGDPGYSSITPHGYLILNSVTTDYWGPNTTTSATGTTLGTGNTNTNTIVTSYGAGTYAAKKASDYVGYSAGFGLDLVSYSDWFLPSQQEFISMIGFNSCPAVISGAAKCTSNFWTSTELTSTTARAYNLNTMSSISVAKSSTVTNSIYIRSF